jgi:hypothetical protein
MPSLGDLLRRLSALSSLSGTASAIGIAIAVAYFMYFVCCALDRNPDLHPVAKSDIARFLKTAQFREEIVLVSRHIGKLFNLLFGHSHFTLRCIKTSLIVTALYFVIFGTQFFVTYFSALQEFPRSIAPGISALPSIHTAITQDLWGAFPYIIIISAIGDYISLGKGRFITSRFQYFSTFTSLIQWLLLDVTLSFAIGVLVAISVVLVAGYMASHGFLKGLWFAIIGGRFTAAYEELSFVILRGGSTPAGTTSADFLWAALFLSTLTTSVWTAGICIAAILVKLLNSLLVMTRWLFEVEKHPIRVIGTVLGPLMGFYLAVWVIFLR